MEKLNIKDQLQGLIDQAPATPIQKVSPIKIEPVVNQDEIYVRQTFVIRNDFLEKLKDLTHMKKQSDYTISQKEVLENILQEYFDKIGEIPERPESVKKLEQVRSDRIKTGKR